MKVTDMMPHASRAVRRRQPHTYIHSHYMCLVIFVCTVYHGLHVMAKMRANSSDHERLPMHEIECFLQYLYIKLLSVPPITIPPPPLPHSGVLISTTASLVVLWIATVAAFGVVTAVLSWQIFKLKQKGMLDHMDDKEMNVSTCS